MATGYSYQLQIKLNIDKLKTKINFLFILRLFICCRYVISCLY